MLVLKRQNTPPSLLKKTQGIVDHFEELFAQTREAFQQERVFQRAGTLAISSLVALGRRTVSGMLCASAQQFQDWTAAYRLTHEPLFFQTRLESRRLLGLQIAKDETMAVAIMDSLHKDKEALLQYLNLKKQ